MLFWAGASQRQLFRNILWGYKLTDAHKKTVQIKVAGQNPRVLYTSLGGVFHADHHVRCF